MDPFWLLYPKPDILKEDGKSFFYQTPIEKFYDRSPDKRMAQDIFDFLHRREEEKQKEKYPTLFKLLTRFLPIKWVRYLLMKGARFNILTEKRNRPFFKDIYLAGIDFKEAAIFSQENACRLGLRIFTISLILLSSLLAFFMVVVCIPSYDPYKAPTTYSHWNATPQPTWESRFDMGWRQVSYLSVLALFLSYTMLFRCGLWRLSQIGSAMHTLALREKIAAAIKVKDPPEYLSGVNLIKDLCKGVFAFAVLWSPKIIHNVTNGGPWSGALLLLLFFAIFTLYYKYQGRNILASATRRHRRLLRDGDQLFVHYIQTLEENPHLKFFPFFETNADYKKTGA